MSNDNDYLLILDRINFPEKILLDRPGHTYTCGRNRENDIVCCSLEVSNRHCTFFYNKTEIYVADLKSANGTFINGAIQQPFQTIKLYLNDIVGIGCSAIQNTIINNDMYVYRLRAFRPLWQEDGDSVSGPSGSSSSNNKEIANDTIVADNVRKRKEHDNSDSTKKLKRREEEKGDTRDTLNAERCIDIDMPTCSNNWLDKSARFSKSEESEKRSEQQSSGEKETEQEETDKRQGMLYATLKTVPTEELETLKNNIKTVLKERKEQKPAS